MKISVSQISEDDGLTIQHLYPEGEPELKGTDSRLVGQPAVSLKATREGDKVQLLGRVSATVQVECDRCLTALSIPVEQSFDLLYVPPVRPGSFMDERELGADDLSVGFYHDEMIDLDDLVREQIELALPMARLCGEDCRGLCPECGANLNEGQCACVSDEIDPRWAALKGLKSDD